MTEELLIKHIELSLRFLSHGSHFHKFHCFIVHTGEIFSGFMAGWRSVLQQGHYHLTPITQGFILGQGLIFPIRLKAPQVKSFVGSLKLLHITHCLVHTYHLQEWHVIVKLVPNSLFNREIWMNICSIKCEPFLLSFPVEIGFRSISSLRKGLSDRKGADKSHRVILGQYSAASVKKQGTLSDGPLVLHAIDVVWRAACFVLESRTNRLMIWIKYEEVIQYPLFLA